MSNKEAIWGVLRNLKEYAEGTGSKKHIAAIVKVEKAAELEIGFLNNDPENSRYERVMEAVYVNAKGEKTI